MSTVIKSFDGIIQKLNISGAMTGPLAGLKFVAKDNLDVSGEITGAGNPDWARTHPAANKHSAAVEAAIRSGGTLVGKACLDEFAYSIDGINIHFGAPNNPQYPDRICGGSSCGSASAVAAKLVDFAIGTDTAGSVRVPASYCGIYGFRPTHGRVSVEGVVPLAPLFDTVGWFAREAELLETCGAIFLKEALSTVHPKKLLIAIDAFDLVSSELKDTLKDAVKNASKKFQTVEEIHLEGLGWQQFVETYRISQSKQAWDVFGKWITETNPYICTSIKSRFDFASTVTNEKFKEAIATRNDIAQKFAELLAEDSVLCMPTTADLPPLLTSTDEELLKKRLLNFNLSVISPLAGTPEVTIPIAINTSKCTGLSFIAGAGSDMRLLYLAKGLMQNAN